MLLCLTVYLPGLRSIPAIDRDEARFAQASRQMAESVLLPAEDRDPAMHSGGIVVPMVGGKPRLNKPPLVYYLQGLSAAAFTGGEIERDAIWMYRVPGVACAIVSVLLTWRLGIRMFDPRAALLGAAILAACPLMAVDAHMARADQLLLVTVVACQTMLWDAWRWARRGERAGVARAALLGAGVGLGIMAKGPITPMVVLLTAAALATSGDGWRTFMRLRPLVVAATAMVIIAPWVVAVGQAVGWETYLRGVWDETLGRAGEAREGHFGPPGYHLVLSAALLWPGSLLTLAGFFRAWRRGGLWRKRENRGRGVREAERFLLAWIVPSWVVFEVALTKLPHYTLPMYPALALISARAVLGAARLPGVRTAGGRFGVRLWGVIGVALALGPVVVLARDMRGLPWYAGLVYVPCAMAAILLMNAFRVDRERDGHVRLLNGGMRVMAFLAIALFMLALPRAGTLWNTERIMSEVGRIDPAGERPLASVGYHEDSLVFATRGRVERIDEERAAAWLAANPLGLVIVPTERVEHVTGRASGVRALSDGWAARPGYNYSNGRRVDLTVVGRDFGGDVGAGDVSDE